MTKRPNNKLVYAGWSWRYSKYNNKDKRIDRTCILNESQISTEDGSTEYDTGKTKITCYYTASLRTWLDQTEWSHNTVIGQFLNGENSMLTT